jgi:uncharacterized membrane protein YkvA (DUF1232 family)
MTNVQNRPWLSTIEKMPTWLLIGICLAYISVPLDLVPDFFCGIGYADDAAVALYTACTIYKRLTKPRVAAHQGEVASPTSVQPEDTTYEDSHHATA